MKMEPISRRNFLEKALTLTKAGLLLGGTAGLPRSIFAEEIMDDEHWRSKRELDGLYDALAQDVMDEKPIVFTTYIGLWGNGEPPEENLYWGKREGHFKMFERAKTDPHIAKSFKNHDWDRIHYEEREEDPLRIAVYNQNIEPNEFWRNKGVEKPFEMKHVCLAYDDIRKAGKELTLHLKQDEARIINVEGEQIDLAQDSRLMGYNGHNFYYDGDFPDLHQIKGQPDRVKGVYSIGCKTAYFFDNVFIDKNIFGLLFTTSFMAPEGYNLLSLTDSVAQGNSGREIAENCNEAYKYFQVLGGQRRPGKLFVNHSHGLFD